MQRELAFLFVACAYGRHAKPASLNQNLHVSPAAANLQKPSFLIRLSDKGASQPVAPRCYESKAVGSSDDKWLRCPAECPVWADIRNDDIHCNFECVEATRAACEARNPIENIPDIGMGICRSCIVKNCEKCVGDGTNACGQCAAGHELVDGKCVDSYRYAWYALFAVLGFLTLFIVIWMVDLGRRPETNSECLDLALKSRSRAKNRQPKETGTRDVWPLFATNMLRQNVAGVEVLLQFNFAAGVILWGFVVALGWLVLAFAVDTDLLILGTRRATTPRQNCILVAWGYETQHRLLWTKVLFVAIVYIASCALCFVHAVRQMRVFGEVDRHQSTHKDFAARIRGLPQIGGTERVEEELAELVFTTTGYKTVGASVCWDFAEYEDDLVDLIECDLYIAEAESRVKRGSVGAEQGHQVSRPVAEFETQSLFARMERSAVSAAFGGGDHVLPKRGNTRSDLEGLATRTVDVHGILDRIKTCPDAYIVFETEQLRDSAVDMMQKQGGLDFRGNKLQVSVAKVEPQTVQWRNCHNTCIFSKLRRVAMGSSLIIAALAVWVLVFYLPYAWFALTFNYSYGQEPGIVASMTFSMVVVAGNQLMYLVCGIVADFAGFIHTDDREVCYMLLFCFACVFNVVLDLVTTYYVAHRVNVGLGMKTYHGELLSELDSFTDIFNTYAMQRTLGQNLFDYSFPSTFLLPFIIEPVVTIFVPYKIASLIVSRQQSIRGFMAERLLGSLVLDLSRYSDILLDIILAALILFFPGGFNVKLFLALAFSHMFVYAMDQYRVLRSVQSCQFSGNVVDWWVQWLLSIPCASLLSCLVFKANCETGYYCFRGFELVSACAIAGIAHFLVHTLTLIFIVPKFSEAVHGDHAETRQYKDTSKSIAMSWFSANPIFCLRSEFVYEHNPPCKFCMPGKEHLLKENPEIGQYFEDKVAEAEEFDTVRNVKSAMVDIQRTATTLSRTITRSVSPVIRSS